MPNFISEDDIEVAGDHFTPREVIPLMGELREIPIPDRHTSIYDPAVNDGSRLFFQTILAKQKGASARPPSSPSPSRCSSGPPM